MSSFAYYLAWLAAGLVAIAIASAAIAWHLQLRVLRRLKALEAIDALARYSAWLAAQHRATFFQGEVQEAQAPLEELRELGRQSFPELAPQAAEVLEVHARVVDYLWQQHLMRLHDPEAWLECDGDEQFMALWRRHQGAVHALADRLRLVAGTTGPRAQSFFA